MYQRVIIIDDSPFERYLAERMISVAHFAGEVTCFSTALDALTYLESLEEDQLPEVIFVDLQMTVMTGFDFLDKYLQFPETVRKRSKVVMLSSTLVDEDFRRMQRYPVISKFLAKPLKEELFRNLVV